MTREESWIEIGKIYGNQAAFIMIARKEIDFGNGNKQAIVSVESIIELMEEYAKFKTKTKWKPTKHSNSTKSNYEPKTENAK